MIPLHAVEAGDEVFRLAASESQSPFASRISSLTGSLGLAFSEKLSIACGAAHEAIRRARLEQHNRRIRAMRGQLLQRRDVIEDVEPAAVSRDHEVVELLLHHRPGHGRVRQARPAIGVQCPPSSASNTGRCRCRRTEARAAFGSSVTVRTYDKRVLRQVAD